MKKIILSALLLSSFHAFAMPYEEFAKKNPAIVNYEKTLGLTLGQPIDDKKIEELGMYVDKKDEKTTFYKARKLKNEIFKIPLADITLMVQEKVLVSLIMEYQGEARSQKIVNVLTQKFGKPLSVVQNNEHFSYIWGVKDSAQKSDSREVNASKPVMPPTTAHSENTTATRANPIRPIAIHPLIVNFDIYQQMGVIIWAAPRLAYKNG